MHRPRGVTSRLPAVVRVLAALAFSLTALLGGSGAVHAQGVEMDATAFLGGHVRPGAWAAVRVDIANDGPDVRGELRIRTQQQGRSIYGVEADLPSGARKQFVLYAQPAIFASRLIVELISGETSIATREVQIRTRDVSAPMVGIIAERPEGFQREVEDAMRSPNSATPVVALLRPEDLPPRVEAWSAMDRLVWQDVDSSRLTAEQLTALAQWIGIGGQLVIVGGSTGPDSLRALPAEILPFVPEGTIDVAPDDLAQLLGRLPDNAGSLPALGGTLRGGTVIGRSGDSVYAARHNLGQGSVAIMGIDPATSWVARTEMSASLWRRLLPAAQGQFSSPFYIPDESSIFQNALYNLPAVALPPIEQLFVLLLAYIALIGPINYLVLRRLDRREWAWLTMPLLVAVFAIGSYGMGAALKGSDVIVNEIAIVRAAPDSISGQGQVYIGVYSPSRRTFEVQVQGGALLASPTTPNSFGQTEQPIDALFGDLTSRLRNFEVGFGVIRGFRADATVVAPTIRADLRLVRGQVQGTVTNASDRDLEHVAIVFAGSIATLPTLAAGETQEVTIRPVAGSYYALSERMFGPGFSRDQQVQRKLNTRRAVIDQISGYGPTVIGTSPDVPLLLAWHEGVPVDVEVVGEQPNSVGDSLYVVPLGMAYDRQATFDDSLLVRTIVDVGAEQGWGDRQSYSLDRGTMILELRPAGLADRFRPSSLEIGITQDGFVALRGNGQAIAPLPSDEQPDQDDPVGEPTGADCFEPPCDDTGGGGGDEPAAPMPEPMFGGLPAVQLFDHRAAAWFELPQMDDMRGYMVDEPGRWLDENGRLLVRFVNRGVQGEVRWFQMAARMEGTIE